MKFRIRFADQVVGAFLLLAVLGIAAILVLVGINQRWFAKDYVFRSRFDSAGTWRSLPPNSARTGTSTLPSVGAGS